MKILNFAYKKYQMEMVNIKQIFHSRIVFHTVVYYRRILTNNEEHVDMKI